MEGLGDRGKDFGFCSNCDQKSLEGFVLGSDIM